MTTHTLVTWAAKHKHRLNIHAYGRTNTLLSTKRRIYLSLTTENKNPRTLFLVVQSRWGQMKQKRQLRNVIKSDSDDRKERRTGYVNIASPQLTVRDACIRCVGAHHVSVCYVRIPRQHPEGPREDLAVRCRPA